MIDEESELARAKWLLGAVAVFLVSGCLSWGELMYLVSGKETFATIEKAYLVEKKNTVGMDTGSHVTIDYNFTEPDGTRRGGTDNTSADWQPPADGKVLVEYTPGEKGNSRLAGKVSVIGLSLFAVSVGLILFFGIRLWKEATEATRDSSPKSRKQ